MPKRILDIYGQVSCTKCPMVATYQCISFHQYYLSPRNTWLLTDFPHLMTWACHRRSSEIQLFPEGWYLNLVENLTGGRLLTVRLWRL